MMMNDSVLRDHIISNIDVLFQFNPHPNHNSFCYHAGQFDNEIVQVHPFDSQIMFESDSILQINSHPIYDEYHESLLKVFEFLNYESMTREASDEDDHVIHISSQIGMHPINQANLIFLHHQHVIHEFFYHEINVLLQNNLHPTYDEYPELASDEPSVVVRITDYNEVDEALNYV